MALNLEFKTLNARELLDSLRNVRDEWKTKTPMQKWCYYYSIAKVQFGLLRIPLMHDVHQVHPFCYFFLLNMSTLVLLSLYTLWYYAHRGELQMGLPSSCMAIILLGHFPTYYLYGLNGRFKLQSLLDFGGRYIYHDNHGKTEYNRICSDHMDRTVRRFSVQMAASLVAYALILIGPTHAYLTNGVQSTLIESRIPFTEPKSNAEFIGNSMIQTLVCSHSFIQYIAVEIFLSILENVMSALPELIKCELDDTIQLYKKGSITELELNAMIRNVVQQSKDADNYVGSISKLFYWRNLSVPTCLTYLIGMAIFCQYALGFVAGYGLASLMWIHLYFFCEMGEQIQDNGFDEMFYQTEWEVLPITIQRVIMLLIYRKQNENGLSLGPFGLGINRETFKLSTEKIYTFVMFLLNFVE